MFLAICIAASRLHESNCAHKPATYLLKDKVCSRTKHLFKNNVCYHPNTKIRLGLKQIEKGITHHEQSPFIFFEDSVNLKNYLKLLICIVRRSQSLKSCNR